MAIYDVNGNELIAGSSDVNITKWNGKKIIVDGSSITSGGSGLTIPTWPSYLTEYLGVSIYNHAVSGTQWVWNYGSGGSYWRIPDYESDADGIIIMGDYNSSWGSLGTISDAADITAQYSYYSRLKAFAEALIDKFPLIPIIWVTEPPRNFENFLTPDDRCRQTATAIEEVGKLYGFPVADCLDNTIFRPYNQTNYTANTSDGTHPYRNIQRGMAQTIIETMKRTPVVYPTT